MRILDFSKCKKEEWTSDVNHTDNWAIMVDEFGMKVKFCPNCGVRLSK